MENALGAVEVAADVLALVGRIAAEPPVLPLHGEAIEAVRRELVVGASVSLLLGRVDRRPGDGPAAGGVDAVRILLAMIHRIWSSQWMPQSPRVPLA
jgi:hypothetical protein